VRSLADTGIAVVLVSSELAELAGLCDRVVVMADGRVTTTLPAAEASEAAILAHALPEGAAAP
jgi:L-arabinose transport system ATP-binding protein